MRPSPRSLALGAALAAMLGGRDAGAYCRSSACAPHDPGGTTQGQICNPAQPDTDCGVELQWRQPCIGFNVQEDASKQVDYATAEQTLNQAFAAWTGVDCGGPPSIQIFDLGPVSCARVEYSQHGGNANVLVFRDDGWPHDSGGGGVDTLALTTVTYDVVKGDIYDADIEVNTAANTFTTSDNPGPMDVDLLSVLTHETGHFLGLAHSQDASATMFASYVMGTTGLRVLQPDDVAGICEAYPVDRRSVGDCTGLPRHGFAPECFADQTYVRCAAGGAGSRGEGGAPGAAFALVLAAAALGFRVRARRGSRGS